MRPAIGNQLEQHPAEVTAKIDGLCASAATIVACHCGKVIAANDSTYMVHPVRMGAYGYYNAEELKKYIEALDAIRESITGLYAKKTGREKDEVAGWMDETKWWTAQQAKENGFIDELVDDAEETVVENRDGMLFVNSVNMHLPFDKAPDFVQSSKAAKTAADCFVNKNCHKEVKNMANEIKTVDDLRGAYPALVNEIEEAAIIQDIPWTKRMFRIIIPIQKSAIISGYMLPFMTCLRELSLFLLLCTQGFILSTTLDYFDEMGLYAFSSAINLILIVTILIFNTLVNKLTGASLDDGIGGN